MSDQNQGREFSKSGFQFSPVFRIDQNECELSLLLSICLFFFPVGYLGTTTTISAQVDQSVLCYIIKNSNHISNFLDFFDEYSLQTTRRNEKIKNLKFIAKTVSTHKNKTFEQLYFMCQAHKKLAKKKPTKNTIEIYKKIEKKYKSSYYGNAT